MISELEKKLSEIGLNMGFEVRSFINNLLYHEGADVRKSILKGENTKNVDALGEDISIKYLKKIAKERNVGVRLIVEVEPTKNSFYDIGQGNMRLIVEVEPTKNSFYDIGQGNMRLNVYLDPVDGTIKLAGLGNEANVLRMINDGVWGFGVSFTLPTDKEIKDLQIKDFVYSTLVDGNPSQHPHFPTNAFSILEDGVMKTFEEIEDRYAGKPDHPKYAGGTIKLITSSQTNLGQGIIGWDAFQGFDRNSAATGTEDLISRVYEKVANRNKGGAFDLWRIYGDFGDILRGHLGYSGLEPQGCARISFNNHLGNAVPVYSVYKGAGGSVVDFSGYDIGERKISEGRTNMVFSANKTVEEKLLKLISS